MEGGKGMFGTTRPRPLAVIVALIVGLVGSQFSPSAHVVAHASEGGEGCNPERSSSSDYTAGGGGGSPISRWDGWQRNWTDGTQIGGATVSLNTYSPYTPSQSPSNNYTLGWSMLNDGVHETYYAQVGYGEFYPGGQSNRNYLFLYNGPNYPHQQSVVITWYTPNNDPPYVNPRLNARHSYTTLWGKYGNHYTGLIDGNDILDPNGNYLYGDPQFNATDVQISAETHTAVAQMLGDTTTPLDMQSVGWVQKTYQNWQTMDDAQHDAKVMNSQPKWFGNQEVSNNEMKVYDYGCPFPTVTEAGDPQSDNGGISGQTDVFMVGTSGTLYHRWRQSGNWHPASTGWEDLGAPEGVSLVGRPGVLNNHPNLYDVYVRGFEDSTSHAHIYHRWYQSTTGWSGYWDQIDTIAPFQPLAIPSLWPAPEAGSWMCTTANLRRLTARGTTETCGTALPFQAASASRETRLPANGRQAELDTSRSPCGAVLMRWSQRGRRIPSGEHGRLEVARRMATRRPPRQHRLARSTCSCRAPTMFRTTATTRVGAPGRRCLERLRRARAMSHQ